MHELWWQNSGWKLTCQLLWVRRPKRRQNTGVIKGLVFMVGVGCSVAYAGTTTLSVNTGKYYSSDAIVVQFQVNTNQKITSTAVNNTSYINLAFEKDAPAGQGPWPMINALTPCFTQWAADVTNGQSEGPISNGGYTKYIVKYNLPIGIPIGTPVATTTCYMPNRVISSWMLNGAGMKTMWVRGTWAASYVDGTMAVYRNGQLVEKTQLSRNGYTSIKTPIEVTEASGARAVDVVYADSVLFSGNNENKEVLHLRWQNGAAGDAAKAVIRVTSNLLGGSGKLNWELDGMNVAEGIDKVVTGDVRLNATAVGWGIGEKGTGNATIEVWVP